MVPLRNGDRLLDDGVSELDDLKPLVDGLNKSLADMMVTSEYVGRPRRWATGIELEEADVLDANGNPTGETEAVNPIPEGDRAMISENPDAKFGQLAAADLAGYEASVRVLLGQIMAVSALPAHYVGVFTDNPASADALRASEASLTARAEARQATFGRSWEQVARLMVAVREGVDPRGVDVRVKWADAATRSVAQEADAVVKLYGAGLLPASVALARLGYDSDEIAAVRTARRAEALDGAGLDLAKLLPGRTGPRDGLPRDADRPRRPDRSASRGRLRPVRHGHARRSRVRRPARRLRHRREQPGRNPGRPVVGADPDRGAWGSPSYRWDSRRPQGTRNGSTGPRGPWWRVCPTHPDPRARVARLGRAEPLSTAAGVYSKDIAASEVTTGWIRQRDPDPCQLCTWWWREGRVWPKDHPMPTHPGCELHARSRSPSGAVSSP